VRSDLGDVYRGAPSAPRSWDSCMEHVGQFSSHTQRLVGKAQTGLWVSCAIPEWMCVSSESAWVREAAGGSCVGIEDSPGLGRPGGWMALGMMNVQIPHLPRRPCTALGRPATASHIYYHEKAEPGHFTLRSPGRTRRGKRAPSVADVWILPPAKQFTSVAR